MVDTRKMAGEQMAAARAESGLHLPRRTRGGHKADTLRTSSGNAARASRGQRFFPRENPTVNCLRNKHPKNCEAAMQRNLPKV